MSASSQEKRIFESALVPLQSLDARITCDGFVWQVHSQLFAERSEFFKIAFDGPFKEGGTKEVHLHDDCPFIIARMIQFVYYDTYDRPSNLFATSCGADLNMLVAVGKDTQNFQILEARSRDRTREMTHALVYQVANKYNIPSLCHFAMAELSICQYPSDQPFFEVLDTIGMLAFRKEDFLQMCMLRSVAKCFEVDHPEFIRFQKLLSEEGDVAVKFIRAKQVLTSRTEKALKDCQIEVERQVKEMEGLQNQLRAKTTTSRKRPRH